MLLTYYYFFNLLTQTVHYILYYFITSHKVCHSTEKTIQLFLIYRYFKHKPKITSLALISLDQNSLHPSLWLG